MVKAKAKGLQTEWSLFLAFGSRAIGEKSVETDSMIEVDFLQINASRDLSVTFLWN